MGLSTHVLDTMNGCPAAGMEVALYSTDGDNATLIKRLVLNHDGRTDAPLFDNASLRTGTYRLRFDVAGYFKARGVELPEPNFLNQVSLDFGIAHADQHYHVPLLVSPWSYSTYRGSGEVLRRCVASRGRLYWRCPDQGCQARAAPQRGHRPLSRSRGAISREGGSGVAAQGDVPNAALR